MTLRFSLIALTLSLGLSLPATLHAANCGNTANGFQSWKQDFAAYARKKGVGQAGLQALAGASYASKTIAADRNQKSFKYSLDKFLKVRGANTIVAQGKKRKAANPGFYASLEKRFGVPAGVLLAIHGMETGFGSFMGDSNVISAITTLAYDCRRPQFFTPHALAALKLVDQGAIRANSIGARHGELGHTQFLPANILKYGIDGNGDGRVDLTNQTDALASTANFLKQKGWKKGAGYQPGERNYRVIQEWNAASVYQQAIALMAAQIDG